MADGDRHVAAGAVQLVGDLNAGRRGADDEHAAGPQVLGPPISSGHDLGDAGRHARLPGAARGGDRA